jgi:spore coat protein U-like protein
MNTAYAATATTTFAVNATIVGTCTASATALAFGSYSPSSSPQTTSNLISITCTNGTAYTIALNGGTTTTGTVAQRLMAGPSSATLNYNIYTVNTYATVWGDGTGTTATQTGTGNGATQNFTGYGQIAASQYNTAGAYSDSVTATVTY